MCKYLKAVCDDRIVCLSLLKGLDATRAPDVGPQESLDLMSRDALHAKLVKALRLGYGWQTPGALKATRKATVNVVPRTMPDAFPGEAVGRVEPMIIPGGKHALIDNRGQLELWSIDPASCLWVAPLHSRGRLDCTAFEFELQQDGSQLIISAAYIDIEGSRT